MVRVLITGASGFVGPYVYEALMHNCGPSVLIAGLSKRGGEHPLFGNILAIDICDRTAVLDCVRSFRPTHVVHLAGISSPADVEKNPDLSWRVNLDGTLNLAKALLEVSPDCWLINVGSGLIYGSSAKTGRPLDELTCPAPLDSYGASKAAADLALGAYSNKGLKVVRMRPFNHVGPGQQDKFALASFASQIAKIEAGLQSPVLEVGNMDSARDYLDVRDVAKAYAKVCLHSRSFESPELFNVASGRALKMRDILSVMLSQSTTQIEVVTVPGRIRPNDPTLVVGDASKLQRTLGWKPDVDFQTTIADLLAFWRKS